MAAKAYVDVSHAAAQPHQRPLRGAAEEMAALAGDFPEFDAALLAGMVEDQGGDVAEVRAGLRVRPL